MVAWIMGSYLWIAHLKDLKMNGLGQRYLLTSLIKSRLQKHIQSFHSRMNKISMLKYSFTCPDNVFFLINQCVFIWVTLPCSIIAYISIRWIYEFWNSAIIQWTKTISIMTQLKWLTSAILYYYGEAWRGKILLNLIPV